MKTVFISSTSRDLAEYRAAAIEICLRMGYTPIAMEYFSAMPVGATKGSLQKLDTADLYVGIFAHRYGYIEDPADGRSVTEIEYDYAGTRGLDRLCFVVDPKHPWAPEFTDHDNHDKLKAFKERIGKLIRAEFTTVDNFSKLLMQALTEWKDANPDRPGSVEAVFAATADAVPDKPKVLFGRDDLLRDVTALLTTGERVLLQGFGGEGKTALAATLAAQWLRDGRGSLVWLRAGSSDLDALLQALARPFGAHQDIARTTGDAQTALMKQILRGAGVRLLVLDDCWNSKALFALLRCLPDDLPALLTARQRYPIDGEIREVGALSPDAALALLRAHARDRLPASDEADGRALCALLTHHAFGIEVAGKTLLANRWTARALLTRIAAAPHDLTMPLDFALAGRESTARLLQTSLDALPDEARAVFFACGAFFAPRITAELVTLYMNGAPVDAALTTLVQHGLLTPIPADNESVASVRLHDLAYSYASAAANADQHKRALDACLAYVARYNTLSLATFAALRPVLDTLLRAADWAAANGQDAAVEQFAWGLWRGSEFLDLGGFSAQATRLLEQAAAAAERVGDKYNQGAHLGNLGNAYSNLGLVERGIAHYEQVLVISRKMGDKRSEGKALGNLGIAYRDLGQVERAIEYYEQALAIAREIGDKRGEGADLGNLGQAYSALGQVERALDYHQQALAIAREIGDKRGEGAALGNLGQAYSALGQVERAIGYYEQSLAIARDIGDKRGEGAALGNLGNAYSALGQVERAIGYYEQSLAIARTIGDRIGEANRLGNLGVVHGENLHDYPRALAYFQQALAIFRQIGAQHLVAYVGGNIARVRGKMGEAAEQ
jgi:tetratricopeptide (TPR) repeat protein